MAKQRGIAIEPETQEYVPGAGLNYLLVIGIDKYQHWEPLHNAVHDARTFADILTRQYQFDEEQVYTLYDTDATEAKIYSTIRELKRKITPQDNLLIYYSGHGHYDEDFAEGHWVPVEARNDNEDAYISNSDIIKRINAITSHHTLVVVDSCFSGTLAVQNRNASVDERFPSRRILASGRNETVSDGQQGAHSPFADGLVTYLRKNTSPQLRTTNLIQYVKDQVAIHSQQTPVEGRIPNSSDKGGEFVFHLRRDEDEYWQEIQQKDTTLAYQDYLLAFPTGKYLTQAERRLTALKEDEVWATVQRNDNETAYDNYLKKYAPQGKYVEQAQQRLQTLKAERIEREGIREQIAAREDQREEMRRQFQELVDAAEQNFNDRNLAVAQKKYAEALLAHLPGFVPKTDYLEEQINLCKTNIEFLRLYDRGQQAANSGNHRLAVQFFQEALKISDNTKVEDLLKHSRAKLQSTSASNRNRSSNTSTQQVYQQTAPPRKKRSVTPIILGVVGGAVLCFIILIAIGLGMEEDGVTDVPIDGITDDRQELYSDDVYTDEPAEVKPPVKQDVPPIKKSVPNNEQLILGEWQTEDVILNGQSIATLGSDWDWLTDITFDFLNDGTVWVYAATGNQQYYYQMEGGQFYISDPSYQVGTLDVLNRSRLQFTVPFTADGGYTYVPMTFKASRVK